MNSIVGKSTGIALLMAAALLAALFAMGVFSATGVHAGVVGGGAKPTVELSTYVPDTNDVTLTAYFTVNEHVDGDPNREVFIVIPSGVSDNLGVDSADPSRPDRRGRKDHRHPERGCSGQYWDSCSRADSDFRAPLGYEQKPDGRRQDEARNRGHGYTHWWGGDVRFHQGSGVVTDDTANQSVTVTLHPSVLASPAPTVGLSDDTAASTADDEAEGDDETDPGENVTVTFAFTVDSSVGDGEPTGHVVITIDADYALAPTNDGTVDGETTATVTVSVGDRTITVTGLTPLTAAEKTKRYTVKVPGQENPEDRSAIVKATFQQGNQPEEGAPMASTYITKEGDEDVTGTVSTGPVAGAAVDMTLEFKAIDAVTSESSRIKVSLSGVSGLTENGITVQVKEGESYADVDNTVSRMGDSFYIGARPDDPEDDARGIAEGEMVLVTISGLTYGVQGASVSASVRQGGYREAVVTTFEPPVTAPTGTTVEGREVASTKGVTLSSNNAGAAVRIDINALAVAEIPGGEDIVVELPKFAIPSSIDESDVLISLGWNFGIQRQSVQRCRQRLEDNPERAGSRGYGTGFKVGNDNCRRLQHFVQAGCGYQESRSGR